MARTQRKAAYNKTQHVLSGNFTRNDKNSNSNYGDENDSIADDDARKKNPIMNDLPDNYLCEGFPNKMMRDKLKELNIDSNKDFFKEESPGSKSFQKKGKEHHHQDIIWNLVAATSKIN